MKRLLGKRGVELNELVGIVVATILIVTLAFFLIKVLGVFSSQDEKNAQAFIESLAGKINAVIDLADLEEIKASPAENVNFTMQGFNGDWAVIGWDIEDTIAAGKPEKEACFGKGCLCICEKKENSFNCQDSGFCKEIKSDKVGVSSTFSYGDTSIPGRETVTTINAECFVLQNKLLNIEVYLRDNAIELKHSYGKYKEGYGDLLKSIKSCKYTPSTQVINLPVERPY